MRTSLLSHCLRDGSSDPFVSPVLHVGHGFPRPAFPISPPQHGATSGGWRLSSWRFATSMLAGHTFFKAKRPYKWMLYGDNGTVFFKHAVTGMLSSLDPGLPYVISDQ